MRWDYYDDGVAGSGEDEIRRGLYETYARLLAFRRQNHTFYDDGAEFRWYVSENEWPGRYMFIKTPDGSMNMALFGNFGSGNQNISVELPHDGTWYNAFTGDTWNGRTHTPNMGEGQFFLLVDNSSAVLGADPGAGQNPPVDPDAPVTPDTPVTPDPDPDQPLQPDPDQPGDNVEDNSIYLKPNVNWTSDGARFAAYFFGTEYTWVSMTPVGDGSYRCDKPAGYPNVIFVRMNPSVTENRWNNDQDTDETKPVWNQTRDLTIPSDGTNCYTVAEGAWTEGEGSWSVK